jgi:hypothetical protein
MKTHLFIKNPKLPPKGERAEGCAITGRPQTDTILIVFIRERHKVF